MEYLCIKLYRDNQSFCSVNVCGFAWACLVSMIVNL